jgi:hypothetical protein
MYEISKSVYLVIQPPSEVGTSPVLHCRYANPLSKRVSYGFMLKNSSKQARLATVLI